MIRASTLEYSQTSRPKGCRPQLTSFVSNYSVSQCYGITTFEFPFKEIPFPNTIKILNKICFTFSQIKDTAFLAATISKGVVEHLKRRIER